MCGIAGMMREHGGGLDQAVIHRMCGAIAHRGPDDEGVFISGGVALGMRRLSIIDVAGGHQPIFNEGQTVAVVCNGEIYNFGELRRDLEQRGHRFSTRSDTEVIVHLYEEYGAECIRHLRGMFAFALYDGCARKLLLVRDRLGKKPLYYAVRNGELIFASEIKAILAARPALARVNRRALLEYMYFGYVPDPATAFEAIRKLPPGHLLESRDGETRVRQYWDLPRYGTSDRASEEELLEEMEQRLAEAVRLRTIADVPLGAMLSGGADSSTIVALMARESGRPVKTFTIGFREDEFDESRHARLVAQAFGTEHHELIVAPDVVASITQLALQVDEPFGDSSALPTYFVSKLARRHVKVALTGDGGDELFAGYDRYRIHLHERSQEWIPAGVKHWYRTYVHERMPHGLPGRNLAYSVALGWEERYLEGISLAPFQRKMGVLTDEFMMQGAPLAEFREYLANAPADDPLSRVLYLDTKTYLAGDILTKIDRMSMAVSLEARVPMLDHKFVEWVTALGPRWKMRDGNQKYILRKLAERVGVPREVLDRPKRGFSLPLGRWMRNELKEMIQTILLEPRTLQRGYFNPGGVRQMLDEHFSEGRDHSARLWRMMMLELWHRNVVEKIGTPAVEEPVLSGGAG